ncbi:substrate-binding domain-containing protein [Pseudarthrobacter siccitolerans]
MEKSATLGFVSDRIASTRYAGPMIRGALRAAREQDHTLFVTETEGDLQEQERAIEALLDRQVDALILATVTGAILMPERQLPVPLVVLNGSAGPGEYLSVLPDEEGGGEQAASHLINLGHRRVHILGTSEPQYWTVPVRRRIESLLSAFLGAGVEVVQIPLDKPVWDFEAGLDTATRAVEQHSPVSAVVALNDALAAGAYEAFRQAGLSIPDDVSVVSFDDDDIVSFLRPQLTTVALPFETMGRRAVEMALSTAPFPAREHLEKMHLQLRHSTRPARNG